MPYTRRMLKEGYNLPEKGKKSRGSSKKNRPDGTGSGAVERSRRSIVYMQLPRFPIRQDCVQPWI